MLKNPIVQSVLTIIVVLAVLKMVGSKIPLVGKYIAL